jgi:hypothetical protein
VIAGTWIPAEALVRTMQARETDLWTPELTGIADLMTDDVDRVGGTVGLDVDAYRIVRRGLIALGSPKET